MSVFQAAMPTGTYPSLMAGGVVAQSGGLSSSTNIDNYIGSDYWGKRYYFVGGQHPVGAPSGLSGGCLLIFRIGHNSTAQIIISNTETDGSGRPVMYQRATASTAEEWSDWEEIVTSDGSYSGLGAGNLVPTALTNQDLDNYRSSYWGQVFYAAGGNTVQNTPQAAPSTESFTLCVYRNGGGSTVQVFYSFNAGTATTFQRVCQSDTAAWGEWKEVVLADGNYPNMGAGHLQEIQITTRSSDTVGWYKCGEFDVSRNTGSGDLSCSVILQINGTNYGNYSESAINAAPSGQIEVDARITSGLFVNMYSSVGIICGNIASTDFCICGSDDGKKMNLYVNISHRYRDFKIIKISEGQENVPSSNIFEFTDEYYGTTAPSNAVYAIVRNIASYAESIPAASQTVLGGVKVYTDSEGYFCIDTQ